MIYKILKFNSGLMLISERSQVLEFKVFGAGPPKSCVSLPHAYVR